jgi:hypothetical protein
MKRIYVVFLGVILAFFTLGNIGSVAMRGDLCGSLANAQEFLEPADESSSNADVTSQPDAVNNIAGPWHGPLTDSVQGDGTLNLTITQKANAASLKGTWSLTFAAGGPIEGTLKGSENNGTGTLNLKNKRHHHGSCIAKAAVTIPDATHMNGTYTTTGGCGTQSTGNFALTSP